MERFIIVAPPYNQRSGGSCALHKLSGTLSRLGYWARIAIFDSDGIRSAQDGEISIDISAAPLCAEEEKYINESIVIYPEVITSNVLEAKRVVWYLLNRDGALGYGKINAGPSDYFLAHSASFGDPRVRQILHYSDFHPAFGLGNVPVPWHERRLNLTYVGKGELYGECCTIPGSVMLGAEWPQNKDELAQLLQVTRYLYTWDSWTALNTEAALCGAVPVILRWGPWSPADLQLAEVRVPYMDCQHATEFDTADFSAKRVTLAIQVEALKLSWNDRVRAFAEDAVSYW